MKGKKIITAIVQRGYQLYHIRCEVSPRLTKKIVDKGVLNIKGLILGAPDCITSAPFCISNRYTLTKYLLNLGVARS